MKALQRELADLKQQFAEIVDKPLPSLNAVLKAKSRAPVTAPPATLAFDDDDGARGRSAMSGDRDALMEHQAFPSAFRRLR